MSGKCYRKKAGSLSVAFNWENEILRRLVREICDLLVPGDYAFTGRHLIQLQGVAYTFWLMPSLM